MGTGKVRKVRIGNVGFGGSSLAVIAGPCVIESRKSCIDIAKKLKAFSIRAGVRIVFKASFDKANRSSIGSYRGPGVETGLDILREVRDVTGLPLITDVHEIDQVGPAAEVVDALQIPAFLCRQTDLLVEAGKTGKPVNIKKGQFVAPDDMAQVVRKVESTGNRQIILTERGSSFGYNNLVADMRSIVLMRRLGYPVVMDATHSVQRPGGLGTRSGGDGELAPYIARAAVAAGCDGVFFETHTDPVKALSDGPNMIPLKDVPAFLKQLKRIREALLK